MIKYLKNNHHWNEIYFIVGLPRSGKSTITNYLNSLSNFTTIDEPLEIINLLQVYSLFRKRSKYQNQTNELIWTNLDHMFSESILGRNFNFREIDDSYIRNFKSEKYISKVHKIKNKLDVIEYLSKNSINFAINLNDCEKSLTALKGQKSKFIRVSRSIFEIAYEMELKKWFSDHALTNNINLLPGYIDYIKFKRKNFFIPYCIPKKNYELFLNSSEYERGLLYCAYQENSLDNIKDINFIKISYNQILSELFNFNLFQNFNTNFTKKTNKFIKSLKKRKNKKINPPKISDNIYGVLENLLNKNQSYETYKKLL